MMLTINSQSSPESPIDIQEYDMHHLVQEQAYYIWQRENFPEGQAKNHWERALVEVSAARRALAEGGSSLKRPQTSSENFLNGGPDDQQYLFT